MEPVVGANSARCPSCHAWVIVTHDRCRPISSGVAETTCPIETCKTTFEVQYHECKLWDIPQSWLKRGYFWEGELRDL